MTHRTFRALGAIAACAVLASCDLESTAPPTLPPVDLSLDFCSDDIPIWIAYQHAGQGWVQVTPDANGTVQFTAEYRIGLAFVHQNGSDTRTELLFTTNLVLQELSGKACLEESGTKTLNGSVAGFSGSELALVGMGFSSVYRTPAQTTFTLANLPTRPLDIMASRMTLVGQDEQHTDRLIIRRSQNLVSGSTIPVLDFNAQEALTPTTATVTINGLSPSSDAAFLTNNFFSQLHTSQLMTFVNGVGNGSRTVEALPAGSLATGDYHDVFVTAVTTNNGVRGSERFFRAPGSHLLAVGPTLSAPIVNTEATSPYLRVRVRLPSQLEYPSAMTMTADQELQFSSNTWTLTVTSNYFGVLLNLWDAQMPDMTGAPGWQNSWGLQNGDYNWTVTAYGVRSELLFGAEPDDGELTQFALRMSDPATAAYRVGAPKWRPPRPYQFGRRN